MCTHGKKQKGGGTKIFLMLNCPNNTLFVVIKFQFLSHKLSDREVIQGGGMYNVQEWALYVHSCRMDGSN